MSGHSHWAGIKYKKAANDSKRGKVFSKISRLITVAARDGSDPEMNPRLRLAIQKAKDVSMPKDNIQRAINRATGADAASLVELTYEGYFHGVPFMAIALTDNGNRTTPEVRKMAESAGAKLGKPGCVAHMFKPIGLFSIKKEDVADADELMLAAIEAGAEDIDEETDVYEIICESENFANLKNALDEAGYKLEVAELTRIPITEMDVDPDTLRKIVKLLDRLDDQEDIQNVYTAAKMTEEIIAEIETA